MRHRIFTALARYPVTPSVGGVASICRNNVFPCGQTFWFNQGNAEYHHQNPSGQIAIFTHGGVIKALLTYFSFLTERKAHFTMDSSIQTWENFCWRADSITEASPHIQLEAQ